MYSNILHWIILAALLNTLTAQQPNIVFLLADDMNRDSWGIYGNKDCKTPNIDRLAKDGTRFERAYCSVAMCGPFRQELYSGRSPWRTETLPNHSKSVPGTKSIVHYLKPLDYRVGLLGKSHVGPKECYPFEILGGVSKSDDANSEILRRSITFFDDCKKKQQPFCLFVGSHDSHAPFTTGDPSRYDHNKISVPSYWVDTPELRKEMVKYYAEVSNFDYLVGMIRAELERRNLWDNTILIVCSEQGSQLPFAKWTCYDNGLRTGLVMHWPGLSEPGTSIEELVSIADITPTLVKGLGGNLIRGACDGRSFLSLLKGEGGPIRKYVYGAFTNCRILDNKDRIYPIRSIRNKRYSLIYNPNYSSKTSNITLSQALHLLYNPKVMPKQFTPAGSWVAKKNNGIKDKMLVQKLNHRPEYEFYDLLKDPGELKNLVTDKHYKKAFELLKKELHTKLSEYGDADPIATERDYLARTRK